jgi:hypothetical protein
MVEEDATGEIVPVYSVHYKWNGIEQQDPQWIIFKKQRVWKVLELNKIINLKEALNHTVDFNASWVEKYGFSPQLSRYESLTATLGFQPTFSEEKAVFYQILHEIESKAD